MNDTLSSLIAFVGFLIVFSMLIQSIQEALKNAFKLRAGVWERFFITLYETDFKMTDLHPETPFWKRVRENPFVGEFEERLKRLKSVVIKSDDIFRQIKADLVEITLMDLTQSEEKKKARLKIEAASELAVRITGLKIESILDLYDKNKKYIITDLFSEFTSLSAILSDIENETLENIQEACAKLITVTRRLENSISAYRMQIETKADAWLVQLQGEYKKNMLKWTLVISALSVILLNADSFSVYEYFSVNAKAQEIMVHNAAAALSQTSQLPSDRLNEIDKAFKEKDLNAAKEGIEDLSEKVSARFKAMGDADGIKKASALLAETQALDAADDSATGLLREKQGQLIALYISLQKKSIDFQMEGLSATGLPIGWRSDANALWNAILNTECMLFLFLIIKKFCGLTLTIFLVSFGAPFWQNIMNALIGLKNLTRKPGAAQQ